MNTKKYLQWVSGHRRRNTAHLRTNRNVNSDSKHSAHQPARDNQLSEYGLFHDKTSRSHRTLAIGDDNDRRTVVRGAGTLWRKSISVACPAIDGDELNEGLEGDVEGDVDVIDFNDCRGVGGVVGWG